MIYDLISNRRNYRDLTSIMQALDYLSEITPDNMPKEKVYLDGDNLFINPQSFTTRPAEECVFEAHRKYIDIHFCISGEESISIASPDQLKEIKAYNPDNDAAFYSGSVVSESVLTPGRFMVCFPEDIHRTGEMASEACKINKVVVKVRV